MNKIDREKRNEKIREMARRGSTLQQIGKRVGLKKNTVHTILAGKEKPLAIRQQRREEERERHWIEKTGYTKEEFKALPSEVYETCRRMLAGSKVRAKENGLDHSLVLRDVVELWGEGVCAVSGEPLERGGESRDNSPSLDRVDNTKGYVKDNVVVMAWRLNRIKHNASVEELELLVKFLKQRGGN